MSFVTKKVKTQTLGEYLSSCRDHLGLSLEEAGRLSQIQPKFLAALEEGRYSDLPATVYVKGFLKSLAKFYRVKEGKLLEQFAAEHEIVHNTALATPVDERGKFFMPRLILSPRTLMVAGVVAVGILSLGYLYFQISSLSQPPILEVFSPSSDGTVDSSLLVVNGRTEAGASVYLNNQPIVADATGEFQENLSLAPGPNQLVIRAVNKFGRQTQISRSILLQEKQIAGSFTSNQGPNAGLTVEVAIGGKPTWIYLEADGLEKYSGTMLAGAKQTISAQNKIVLTTGNAGATQVILNGKDLGILGKDGEVIRDIEFTSNP